ncbi:MAG: GAF domain-containing protein [Myxococcaceae bacterium]
MARAKPAVKGLKASLGPRDLKRLFAALPSGVVYLVDDRVVWANEAALRLLGLSLEEATGRASFDFLDPDDAARVWPRYEARLQGKSAPESYELTLLRPDRSRVRVEIEPRALGVRSLLITLRDVGARARDAALLAALGELAAKVQRARTEREVLSTVGEGLLAMGMASAVLRLEGEQLRPVQVSAAPGAAVVLARLGVALNAPVPLSSFPASAQVVKTERPLYQDDVFGYVAAAFTHLSGEAREKLAAEIAGLDCGKAVLAPLVVQGAPWGLLWVAAGSLTSPDAAAVGLFASQVASALESAGVIADLERKNRHLAAIHALAAEGAKALLEPSPPEMARTAALATESDAAAIFLLDEERSELVLAGDFGKGVELGRKYNRLPVARTATGEPVQSRRARALNVARDWPAVSRADVLAAGLVEVATVPMMMKGRVVGTLNLSRNRPEPYSADELQAAEMLAGQIAVQLENARLHQEEKRRVRQLSLLFNLSRIASEATEVAPLVARVLDEVTQALGVDAGVIRLLENDQLVIAGSRGEHFDAVVCPHGRERHVANGCACGRTASQRQTTEAISPHPGGGTASSVAVTPLVANDRLIGTFCVVRGAGKPLGEDEVRLLESCGGQVGVAIEHARHLEDERRRVRDLALINELGGLISQHLELSDVLAVGMRHLSRITDAPNAFLMLLDRDGGPLRLVATNLDDPELADFSMPRAETLGALKKLAASGPMVMNDPLGLPGVPLALVERYSPRGLLTVPLLNKGEAMGCIALGETRPGRRFTSAEVDRALAVANQLATAISNARLYENERRRAEQFRLLHDVGRAITASLDLEQTLVAAANGIVAMVEASGVFIWLLDPGSDTLRGAATSAPAFREDFLQARMPLGQTSLATLCIRRKGPVWASDTAVSEEVFHVLCERYGAASLMAIPLLLRDEVIGAVVITDARRGRVWSDAEIERATIIARQVAVAVANARLFDDLKRSYDALARTQEVLVKRERLAALGELAAVVAHEVRNPLGVIFNSLGALKRPGATPSEASLLLQMVGEEADRLNRIVGGLLDFARPHEPALEPESLEGILNGAVEAAAAGARDSDEVRVECRVDGGLDRVWVDARMLRQALVNLVVNALQASPRLGKVAVLATPETRRGRPMVRVEVSDSGPGIAPELTERVFQPFFTTKATGTGLGLAVVKRIVEAHHGEIEVGRSAGGGAKFTLRLPVEAELPSR